MISENVGRVVVERALMNDTVLDSCPSPFHVSDPTYLPYKHLDINGTETIVAG